MISNCSDYTAILSGLLEDRSGHECIFPLNHSPFVEVRRRGLQVPQQGWKLHVSSDLRNSSELIRSTLPIVMSGRAHFKIAASSSRISALNHGDFGISQIGKILTIYPETEDVFRELSVEINKNWRPNRFPSVDSDYQFLPGSAVFCRWGDFEATEDLAQASVVCATCPDGLRRDPLAIDGIGEAWSTTGNRTPDTGSIIIDGNWFARAVLLRRLAKGVLHFGFDDNLRTVIIKTAMPGTCEDDTGYDAADRLMRESEFLRFSRNAKISCSEVLAFSRNPLPTLITRDFPGKILTALERFDVLKAVISAAHEVALLHQIGIVHRDLSPDNIVYQSGKTMLLDFELAAFFSERAPYGENSVFTAPEANIGLAGKEQDVYSLAATTGAALLSAHGAKLPKSRDDMLCQLRTLLEHDVAAAVSSATEADPKKRCSLPTFRQNIKAAFDKSSPNSNLRTRN